VSGQRKRRQVAFQASRADKIRAVLALGAVFGLGSVSTLAAWSDTATATSSLFSTGTLDIKVNDQDTHTFVNLSMSDMVPGSTKSGSLVVKNAGAMPFRYTTRAVVSGDSTFGKNLRVSVNNNACPGTSLVGPTVMDSTLSPIAMIGQRGPIAANGTETFCFTVTLDNALWNSANWNTAMQIEGKSVNVSFEFIATAS
jgi:predicted ribosomally synthesized peptide with SipW-like signal peptide